MAASLAGMSACARPEQLPAGTHALRVGRRLRVDERHDGAAVEDAQLEARHAPRRRRLAISP